MKLFVAGCTARAAAELTGVNRNASTDHFMRLRMLIVSKLQAMNCQVSLRPTNRAERDSLPQAARRAAPAGAGHNPVRQPATCSPRYQAPAW